MRDQGAWLRMVCCEDMRDGDMKNITIGEAQVALYRVAGKFFATSNICTHAFAILSDGWLDGEVVECPLHAGRFNVRTGKALCHPVTRDLKVFPVRVVDGYVEVLASDNP